MVHVDGRRHRRCRRGRGRGRCRRRRCGRRRHVFIIDHVRFPVFGHLFTLITCWQQCVAGTLLRQQCNRVQDNVIAV